MESAEVLAEVLARSGMTKSALCSAAGISRSQLDDYLKGRSRPSVAQLERIADAAGFELDVSVRPKPRPISPEFVAVLEFGDLFPRKPHRPLVNLGPVWRQAAALHEHG